MNDFIKLRREVATLRSFVIGVAGRDSEGVYRSEFVRRILRASNEKPVTAFENPRQFLDLLAEQDQVCRSESN